MGKQARTRAWTAAACGLALLAAASGAGADVTVERFIRTGGFAGLAASESTAVEKLSGLKKREVHTTRLTGGGLGGLLGKIAGDMGSDSITNVAKDTVWSLDHKKKSYTEESISAAFRELQKGDQAQTADQGQTSKEESDVRVVKNEISVKETGEKKTISGFPCTLYVVTWLLETENVKTKERSRSVMTTDLWNTPETRETKALAREEGEFSAAYLRKIGVDASAAQSRELGLGVVAGLFGGDQKARDKGMAELREQMAKIKGFNIATAVRWEANAGDGAEAARPRETKPQEAEPAASTGGLAGMFGLAKKLMGGAEEAKPAEPAQPAAAGSTALFDSYTEIRRIDLSSIGAKEFEVPSGYQLAR
ncbi:MAG: hypothetical protein HZB55_02280 [Deltaproteobacteria bacterium]|nr:hypothetical protein [Deltaproteobacteria bacterium]